MRRHTKTSDASTSKAVSVSGLSLQYQPLSALKPYPHNARTHSKRQIRQIAASISNFGFTNPILVDSDNVIIAGHGRCEAAKLLGIEQVPTIPLADLTPDQVRAYVIADNKLAEEAGWDASILAIELQHLVDLDDFDVSVTGFEVPEMDRIFQQSFMEEEPPEERVELKTGPAVSRSGDVWALGKHRLICGNSLEESTFATLMGKRRADVVFTDPPYNVRIDGNVCGKGAVHHREFAMASGEMSSDEFIEFLTTSFRLLGQFSTPPSVHYICMDWRHIREVLTAGQHRYRELLNLCIWIKPNGGMGSFYRSRHELVFVYRNGKGAHRNNIQLGKYGRNRTNVWEYAGANTLANNDEGAKLSVVHPTVKPVAMVADALLDSSARGEIVLDSFIGSGTTLLAAERVGRICYGIEIDPTYVDVAIRRWQRYTGEQAVQQSGKCFEEVAAGVALAGTTESRKDLPDCDQPSSASTAAPALKEPHGQKEA